MDLLWVVSIYLYHIIHLLVFFLVLFFMYIIAVFYEKANRTLRIPKDRQRYAVFLILSRANDMR